MQEPTENPSSLPDRKNSDRLERAIAAIENLSKHPRDLATEIRSADPPSLLLERARRLAEHAQGGSLGVEGKFAWSAFVAAGGGALTPWLAFKAGLAAQVDWLQK